MPGIAVVNTQNAGLQVALVLGIACVVGRLVTAGFRRDAVVLLACGWWAAGLAITVQLSPVSGSANSALAIGANIVLLGGLALTAAPRGRVPQSLLAGFMAGGVISSGYCVWQQLARYVEIPFAIPPLNNHSFFLITAVADQEGALVRSYGLCPEPSVLASLLIPCLVVSVVELAASSDRRLMRSLRTAVLSIGMICCGSLSIVISLPLALVFVFAIDGRLRKEGFGIVLALLVLAAVSGAGIAVWEPAQERAIAVVSRLRDITDDQSVIQRLSSMIAGLRMFLDYPVFGYGILPPPDLLIQYWPDGVSQYNAPTGPLSLIIGILSGQGLVGAIAVFVLCGLALKRSVRRPVVGPLLVSLITVGVVQIGYFSLYHFWVIPGIALSLGGVKRSPAASRQRDLPPSHHSPADGLRQDCHS
jgi:hypothetical protein